MTISRITRENAYEPFKREAEFIFWADVGAMLIFAALLFLFGAHRNAPWLFLLIPLYFAVCALFKYRTALYSHFDNKKCRHITERLYLHRVVFDEKGSLHKGKVIKRLYPKRIALKRYTVICKKENGEEIILRTAISERKYKLLTDTIDSTPNFAITVSYGKKSRVILSYSDRDETSAALNNADMFIPRDNDSLAFFRRFS